MSTEPAKADVSFSVFYSSLGSHGDWIEVGDYGYCWRPRVSAEWRPYSDGYWAYTDCGWTWVSYEDYGWAVYHYGRWVNLDDDGWCWVPGYEWGPAWVSWRDNDDYVGWAPLPPEARWDVRVGFGFSVDRDYDIGPGWFNFCAARDFGSPVMRNVIVDRRSNVTIINQTKNITNITINKNKKVVYNGGPNYQVVNKRANRPIRAMKLVQKQDIDVANKADLRAHAQGDELVVAAPVVQKDENVRPERVAKKVNKDKVNKGWADAGDPQQVETIRAKIDKEAKGGHKAAKPVDEQEIQAVDEAIARQPKENKKNKKAAENLNVEQPAVAPEGVAADDAVKQNRKKNKEAEQALQPFEPKQKKQVNDQAEEQLREQKRAERQNLKQQEEQEAIVRQKKQQKAEVADEPVKQQRKAERQMQIDDQERQQRQLQRQQDAAEEQARRQRQAERERNQQQMINKQQRRIQEQPVQQQQQQQMQQQRRQTVPAAEATPSPEGKKKNKKNKNEE